MLNASSVAVDLSLSITGHFQAQCTLIQIADDPVLLTVQVKSGSLASRSQNITSGNNNSTVTR